MASTRVLYLRIPQDLHDEIEAIAENERRKINGSAQILLEEAIAARKATRAAREDGTSEWQIHMLWSTEYGR